MILFAQELGAGYGHVTNLVAVARHFPETRRAFVLPHPDLARPVLAANLGPEVRCVTAPALLGPRGSSPLPERTMADILHRLGFADGPALSKAVGGWAALLDQHRPDLVVADYAPTLRIAAAGRVPHVVLSNGFCIPPDLTPVPPFRASAPSSGDAEEQILTAANAARRGLGLPPLPRFTSLLYGDETFVTTFSEIDIFAGRRSARSVDPLNVPHLPIGPALRDRTGPHIFCYLDAREPPTNPVLTALNGLARPSRIFVRNIDPHVLAPHCGPQVEICTSLADLGAIAPQARLVVHPGTQGTAGAALLAGTPQLLVPHSLDGELTSERLRGLGVGAMLKLGRTADPAGIRAVMERILDDPAIATRAFAVARDMQARRVAAPERPVVEACRAMLKCSPR